MSTRHRPRRRFGQNFLRDRGAAARMVELIDPRPGEAILEIGPGEGALTRPLLARAGALAAVELDRDLAAALRAEGLPGLRLVEGDVLTLDIRALAPAEGRLRVVGNVPYNITSPLLFHLLEAVEVIADLHLLLQREVVARLAAHPGNRDYGRLTVAVQYRCRVESLFTLPPGAFRPPPKVESAFVRLTPHPVPPVAVRDEAALERVVAAAFNQRRKTLRNSLDGLLPAAAIAAAGVDPGARAETLSLAEFAALADQLAA